MPENVDKDSRVYFLRTNVATFDEKTTNNIYELLKYKKMPFRKVKIQKSL